MRLRNHHVLTLGRLLIGTENLIQRLQRLIHGRRLVRADHRGAKPIIQIKIDALKTRVMQQFEALVQAIVSHYPAVLYRNSHLHMPPSNFDASAPMLSFLL